MILSGQGFDIYVGDVRDVLRDMPDGSADCVVTSPPYFGLRDYGVDGQIGQEATPDGYVDGMVGVFREVRRVLRRDGTLWLNIGDSYARKNLIGIPWRLVLAMQDDGWILRNDIVWNKPNAMPESVRDRFSSRHEYVFFFTASPRYFFDLDAVRVPTLSDPKFKRAGRNAMRGAKSLRPAGPNSGVFDPVRGKNPGDVWDVAVRPFPGAHFATFPPDLPRRCIRAGCRPDGVVLDPFMGSGTTGMVALSECRRFVGIELNPEYANLAVSTRLAPWSEELSTRAA